MSVSASEELEKLAVQYALEAVQFDKRGARDQALNRYTRAVEILAKICSLYPDAPQNRVYEDHIRNYRQRIKSLQENNGHLDQTTISKTDHANYANQLVLQEKPNVKWNDIADLEDAKRAVEESVIFPIRRPDLFPLGWPRGILFFGPPGCGKTLLAAAIATEINAVFYSVDAASIMSKWLGESEKNVAGLFKSAKQAAAGGQPAIIFIDEIDSLVGVRHEEVGGEIRTRNQFLNEMDSVLDKKSNHHVYVIGATNKPWVLDQAFIRRFQKRIFVPLPTSEARLRLINLYSRDLRLSKQIEFSQLVRMTAGYSGSDVRDIFQAAQIKVVRELFEDPDTSGTIRQITQEDFNEILSKRRPSVSPELMQTYERWFEKFKAV